MGPIDLLLTIWLIVLTLVAVRLTQGQKQTHDYLTRSDD